jgi:hypothetical protein
MKNLLTFGCSFTDIDDEILLREYEIPKKYAEPHNSWPVELARLTNSDPICKGRGGVGNFYIVNKLYETIDTSKYHWANSIVIVMWSGIDRVDFVVSDEEFHHFERVDSRDQWIHSGGRWQAHRDRYWYNYYKTYHTEENSYIQTLQYMIGAQEFLSNRKIPYLFLTYKDIFTDRRRKYKRAKNLENLINWDRFHFPNGEFGGEFEWVKDNNLTWADDKNHPSSESHRKFARYLYNLEGSRYLFT